MLIAAGSMAGDLASRLMPTSGSDLDVRRGCPSETRCDKLRRGHEPVPTVGARRTTPATARTEPDPSHFPMHASSGALRRCARAAPRL